MTETTKLVEPSGKRKPPRAGMGRPKGSLNKSTADIKMAAQLHGEAAIIRLAELMHTAESEQAQIAAAKELLDRGYGKAVQAIEASGPNGGAIQISQIQLVALTPDQE